VTAAALMPLLSAASTISYGPPYQTAQTILFPIDSAASQSGSQSRCPLVKLREDVRLNCGMTALMSCPASLSPHTSLRSLQMPPISFYAVNEQFNIQNLFDDMLNLSLEAFDQANAVSSDTAQDAPVQEKKSVEENSTADENSDNLEEEIKEEPLDKVIEEEQSFDEIDSDTVSIENTQDAPVSVSSEMSGESLDLLEADDGALYIINAGTGPQPYISFQGKNQQVPMLLNPLDEASDEGQSTNSIDAYQGLEDKASNEDTDATPEEPEEKQSVQDIDSDQVSGDKDSYNGLDAKPAKVAEDTLDEIVTSLFRSLGVAPVEERLEQEDLMSPLPVMIDFPALDDLPIFLFQFGNGLLMDGQRRRLSEGEVDPHPAVKERLGRRLTEYVHMETFTIPSYGGTVIHHSHSSSSDPFLTMVNPVSSNARNLGPDSSVPRLGFGNHDVDSCIYSMYANSDLSGGCHDSVHSLLIAHASMAERKMKMLESAPVDDGAHVVSPALAFFVCLIFAAACTSSLALCAHCLGMDVTSILCSVMVFISTLTFGWVSLAVTLPAVLICNWLRDDSEEEDGEEADDFDYVKCPEDDSDEKSSGDDQVVCVGIPIRIV